jgi:hypothetical protein
MAGVMMPRFFLHLCDRSASVFDNDGIELQDLTAALEHAAWCVRDIVSNCILSGQVVDLGSYIALYDIAGLELARVLFREVVTFLDDDPNRDTIDIIS